MSPTTYFVIAAVVGILCLLIGGYAGIREGSDDGPGLMAVLAMLVVLGAACGGLLWPLTLLIGVVWGGLLLCRRALEKREAIEVYYPAVPESDADKYRRMAREECGLARLHRETPELAKMHEQLAQQYEGMADLYSG